jgi:signal transduction histidine kinase
MEYRLIAADGRIIWLHDLVSLVVEDGEPVRLRGVMFDITERRRLQEERDRLLSEEQAHRAAAEAAVGARDEFLSIASHELRTPITSLHLTVQSLLRLVRKSQLGQMPEQLGEALVIARRQTQRLRRLIDAMLDTSRIQAGRIELEPVEVDLSALTQEVARHFSEDLAAAGCSLCLQTAHPIKGYWDPERIEQVISNLVSNAIKYGAGSEILLRVEDQGDLARLIVRDGGIGIAREHHAKIFERFERSASARQYGGLGLGLFIARRLVQAHGGTIQVDSEEGAGSTFTVELPKGTRAGL